jgi:hypothetical protein
MSRFAVARAPRGLLANCQTRRPPERGLISVSVALSWMGTSPCSRCNTNFDHESGTVAWPKDEAGIAEMNGAQLRLLGTPVMRRH